MTSLSEMQTDIKATHTIVDTNYSENEGKETSELAGARREGEGTVVVVDKMSRVALNATERRSTTVGQQQLRNFGSRLMRHGTAKFPRIDVG